MTCVIFAVLHEIVGSRPGVKWKCAPAQHFCFNYNKTITNLHVYICKSLLNWAWKCSM